MKKIWLSLLVFSVLFLSVFSLVACGEPETKPPEKEAAVITITDKTKRYDGTVQGVTASVEPASAGTLTVVYTQNGTVVDPKKAGAYDVQVTLVSDTHIASVKTAQLNIAPKELTLSGITAAEKTYDGGKTVTLGSQGTLNGIVAGDTVNVSVALETVNKTAGQDKSVKVLPTLGGIDAGNYTVKETTGVTVNVAKKQLTIDGITITARPQSENVAAEFTGIGTLIGILGDDEVGIDIEKFEFQDAAAGKNKPMKAFYSLTGADRANYEVAPICGVSGQILPVVNGCVLGEVKKDDAVVAYEVTGYVGGAHMVMPEIYEALPVVGIADRALIVSAVVTELTVSANAEYIGFEAFRDSALAALNFSDRVGNTPKKLKLGQCAFFGTKLTTVTVPGFVSEIGIGCFQNTAKLKSATFAESVYGIDFGSVPVDGGFWTFGFSGVETLTVGGGITAIPATFAQNSALKTLVLGGDVASIGFCAFIATPLTSVELSSSLRRIEEGAFKLTTSLSGITLNKGLVFIGQHAFNGGALTSIEIPNTVTRIADGAFGAMASLSVITFEEGGTAPLDLLPFAFFESHAATITIPARMRYIGWAAFAGMPELTTVIFAEGNAPLAIGNDAFDRATKLTAVTLPQRLTAYANNAFDEGCVVTDGDGKAVAPDDASVAIPA